MPCLRYSPHQGNLIISATFSQCTLFKLLLISMVNGTSSLMHIKYTKYIIGFSYITPPLPCYITLNIILFTLFCSNIQIKVSLKHEFEINVYNFENCFFFIQCGFFLTNEIYTFLRLKI